MKALPRILHFKVTGEMQINLSGLQRYAPCIFYFKVEGNGVLTLISDGNTAYSPIFSDRINGSDNSINVSDNGKTYRIAEKGLYQIIWITTIINDKLEYRASVLKLNSL